nr:putative AMP-binding protein [uncultured bacterium]
MPDKSDNRKAIDAARQAGLLEPGLMMASATSFALWGASAAMPYAAAAVRRPFRTAVVDDYGSLTYLQLHTRTDRVAGALRGLGIAKGDAVGLMCRNHRGFVEANIAAAKLGARAVYVNTGLPADQLGVVAEREELRLILHDEEFSSVVARAGVDHTVVVAPEDDPKWSFPSLDRRRRFLLPTGPGASADPVILTSGTTGVPKGARRPTSSGDAAGAAGMLAAIPYRSGDTVVVAAPLFHAWGLSQHLVAATLHGTVVLQRKFEAEGMLELCRRHEADVLAAVPVMLTRMLDTDSDVALRQLRITATSGAPLPGDLAQRWMDRHGDHLYNMYGSTEVGQATIAGPADLRDAPGTAGCAPLGVTLRVLGANDETLPPGEIGEVVVESNFTFEGYTGGGTKDRRGGAMVTGDTGYLDHEGRLFITGRADDMIISGGENLYPAGIEDTLLRYPGVREVAVVGVADDTLGQRVRAVLVVDPGVTAKKLKAHAKRELATYEVPKEFLFVAELPRNATGKILRRQLAELPAKPR